MTDTITSLPISLVIPSADNPRKTSRPDSLAELADSIHAIGLQQPIVVRPVPHSTGYEIVFGHRRYAAVQLNGGTEIDCIIRPYSNSEAAVARLHENLEREGVHWVEEAEAMASLIIDHGYTAEQLASHTGKKLTYVYSRLKLAKLHPIVRDVFLANPDWSPETATLVARVPTSLQPQALERISHTAYAAGAEEKSKTLMSYRQARDTLRSGYTLQIASAPWAACMDMGGLHACQACPKATHNDKAFSDAPEGLCTDPDCWRSKEAEHQQITVDAMRAAGRVIEVSSARDSDEDDDDSTGTDSIRLLSSFDRVTGPGGESYSVRKLLEEATAAGIEVQQHALIRDGVTTLGLTEDDARDLVNALAEHHGMDKLSATTPVMQSQIDVWSEQQSRKRAELMNQLKPHQQAVANEGWIPIRTQILASVPTSKRCRADLVAILLELISAIGGDALDLKAVGFGAELDAEEAQHGGYSEDFVRSLVPRMGNDQIATLLTLEAISNDGAFAISTHTATIDHQLIAHRLSLAAAYGIDVIATAGLTPPEASVDDLLSDLPPSSGTSTEGTDVRIETAPAADEGGGGAGAGSEHAKDQEEQKNEAACGGKEQMDEASASAGMPEGRVVHAAAWPFPKRKEGVA